MTQTFAHTTIERPKTYDEVTDLLRSGARVLAVGGGTKPNLSAMPEGYATLSTTALTGIVEYQPSEFTITARAGTPLREVIAVLADNGQYLPWDPPLVDAGATLGGAIAAGLSGSGRYRYGGLRDFLVGIRFVDGQGRLVRGGGKVVKNAAGFDLPKLFVGSMGRLGVLVEATFKVFPQPPSWATVCLPVKDVSMAQGLLARLGRAPLDLSALDVEIDATGQPVLWLRLGGLDAALPERIDRLQKFIGGGELQSAETESAWWQQTSDLKWVEDGATLFYASLLPSRLAEVDGALARFGVARRYLSGGTILWVAAEGETATSVERTLTQLALPALRVRGLGAPLCNLQGTGLLRRVKSVLDPHNQFPGWE